MMARAEFGLSSGTSDQVRGGVQRTLRAAVLIGEGSEAARFLHRTHKCFAPAGCGQSCSQRKASPIKRAALPRHPGENGAEHQMRRHHRAARIAR